MRRGASALLVFLILAALATAKPGDAHLYPPKAGDAVTIYLVDNGDHTDLAIPRGELLAHGGPSGAATASMTTAPWVMAGWGDERFYEAEGPFLDRIPDGLRALFAPHNSAVVHLQGVSQRPDLAFDDGVHRIVLSRAGLAAMLGRMDASFRLGPDGEPIVSPAARSPNERFFKSVETFSFLHLCNHWTAELLNAAGLPVTPVLDTLPIGLVLDLRLRRS
jgi:uncharacterized protein (TIGR02117 family)